MAEWFKAAVLKTVVPERVPWVRILPPPPWLQWVTPIWPVAGDIFGTGGCADQAIHLGNEIDVVSGFRFRRLDRHFVFVVDVRIHEDVKGIGNCAVFDAVCRQCVTQIFQAAGRPRLAQYLIVTPAAAGWSIARRPRPFSRVEDLPPYIISRIIFRSVLRCN